MFIIDEDDIYVSIDGLAQKVGYVTNNGEYKHKFDEDTTNSDSLSLKGRVSNLYDLYSNNSFVYNFKEVISNGPNCQSCNCGRTIFF